MKIRSVKYHLKQGAKNVLKNGLMSFASIASVSICTFMLVVSLCLAINLDSALEKMEESMGISVFLGEEVTDEEVKELLIMLEDIPNVSNIEYISKEEAFNWAEENLVEDKSILEGLEDDNPLPRSFKLTIDGVKYQKQVITELEKIQYNFEKNLIEKRKEEEEALKEILESPVVAEIIEEQSQEKTSVEVEIILDDEEMEIEALDELVIAGKDYQYIGIEKIRHSQRASDILLTTNNAIRIISIITILMLAIISVGIIINTIKLTVYVRKNEINIMKYVGATDWFIRWPFVVEGVIIGLIGSLISITVCMA
ncbi:MAG: ABC transporter permease, partial [Eubacteriales bacterium]|nr:ABC transporter permease [Eubacteriales bacterium]